MKFITIDFETANYNLDSACSLGMVIVDDNNITKKEFLINPHQEFSPFNISIHHITPLDVKDSPSFKEVWDLIKDEFNDVTVYAHNASFDIGVLKACMEKYKIEIPNITYGCTLQIARKIWKNELINHRLNTIASFLDVELNHHNALSDAYVCVEIIKRGMKIMQVDNDRELYNCLGLSYKRIK